MGIKTTTNCNLKDQIKSKLRFTILDNKLQDIPENYHHKSIIS